MAAIDLTQVGEFVIKHGAKAVLLVWVASQQLQINEIRKDYKDCMNDRVIDSHRGYVNSNKPVAVLPKQIKIKAWEEKQPRKS